MVRGAITPMADVQMEAVNWMRRFFEVQGDHCPDSGDIKLQVMLKSDVYKKYCNEMTGRRVVVQSKFSELWNTLFPYVRRRTFCDIPGKCDICYEIDRQRRKEHDTHTAKMLQEAHLMHRGGMFHIQRER